MDLLKTLLLSGVLALGVAGCDDNNFEDAGDNIEDAAEDVQDGLDDACDEATDGNC